MGVSTLRKRINNFSCQKCIEFLTQHAFVAGLTANLSLRAPHVKAIPLKNGTYQDK